MKARIALLAAPLVLLAACGGSDTKTYKLSSGSYAVSGATVGSATPGDQCQLLPTYQVAGKRIGITVNPADSTAVFDLTNPGPAVTQPSATIKGNSIEAPVEASYTANVGNCVLRIKRSVVGELTGDDAAALQLRAQITIEVNGTDCAAPYTGAGCQSDIHFLANKVP